MSSHSYETRFTAVNYASPTINQISGDFSNLEGKVTQFNTAASTGTAEAGNQMTFFKQKLDLTKTSADNAAASFNSLRGSIFGLQMSMFYVSMLTSNMGGLEQAANNVEGAQERLNKVLQESGRNTYEYRNAVRQLENAQLQYKSAQNMTMIMQASMGLQLVNLAMSFQSVIPAIKDTINTLKSYNIVAAVSKALSGNWVALAAGLAVGAGAVIAVNRMQDTSQSELDTKNNVSGVSYDINNRYNSTQNVNNTQNTHSNFVNNNTQLYYPTNSLDSSFKGENRNFNINLMEETGDVYAAFARQNRNRLVGSGVVG